jgi:hypothetical protein
MIDSERFMAGARMPGLKLRLTLRFLCVQYIDFQRDEQTLQIAYIRLTFQSRPDAKRLLTRQGASRFLTQIFVDTTKQPLAI